MNESAVKSSRSTIGFWLYLMSDIMLFTALFATFVVLRHSTNGGPAGSELFSLPYVFVETLVLLVSSCTAGIAMVAMRFGKKTIAMVMLTLTILLGITFLVLEIHEFVSLAGEGHSWQASAFLSAFFTLVGTHGAHITAGLIWAIALLVALGHRGIDDNMTRRVGLFSLFWHFLDLVWIFIFSVVYLLGAVS